MGPAAAPKENTVSNQDTTTQKGEIQNNSAGDKGTEVKEPSTQSQPNSTVQNDESKTQEETTQPKQIEFFIPEGASAVQIAGILQEKGLIKDQVVFSQMLIDQGIASNLARGNFVWPEGLTMEEMVERLKLK